VASANLCKHLVTGICEEAVFRGYLLGTLQKGLGFWPATAISSVLFAVVYLPNYGERASGIFVCALLRTLRADGQTDRHDLVCRGIPRGMGLVPDLFVWNLR